RTFQHVLLITNESDKRMQINKFIRRADHPPRADQSAVGAINRPLQVSGLFCSSAISARGRLHHDREWTTAQLYWREMEALACQRVSRCAQPRNGPDDGARTALAPGRGGRSGAGGSGCLPRLATHAAGPARPVSLQAQEVVG